MPDHTLVIQPIRAPSEHHTLARGRDWQGYHRVAPRHHVIVALAAGQIAGYCAVDVEPRRPHELAIIALESRQPGTDRALLGALKARAVYLVVEDVPHAGVAWWLGQGFAPPSARRLHVGEVRPSRAGALSWHRWDDPFYEDAPLEPFWGESVPVSELVKQAAG